MPVPAGMATDERTVTEAILYCSVQQYLIYNFDAPSLPSRVGGQACSISEIWAIDATEVR